MNAVDKWNQPGAEASAIESVRAIEASPVRVLKDIDLMKSELEGFTKADYYHEKPFIYIVQNIAAGDRDAYDELIGHITGFCIGLKQVKISKKEIRDLIDRFEKQNPCLIPAEPKHSDTVLRLTWIDDLYKDRDVDCDFDYGRYSVTNGGIMLDGECICMNPVVVSEIRKNINTADESVTISFRRSIDSGWRSGTLALEKAKTRHGLLTSSIARQGCDISEYSAMGLAEYIRTFIGRNLGKIPEVAVSERLGWTNDGYFVPFTGNVQLDDSRLGVFTDMGNALRAHGDPETWLAGMREFRKLPTARQTILLMDGSFASPLVSLTDGLPFWIHMSGNGTTGKTVSMRMAATIWGYAPGPGATVSGWMKTMNQTTNKLEELANFANHLPLCLNELQVLQRVNPKVLVEFVYKICEGEGHGRLDRNGKPKKSALFALITLSCGELGLLSDNEHGGAKSRVIDLILEEPIMDRNMLKPFCNDVLNKSYGHAGPMFLDAISSMSVEEIKAEIAEITERLQKHSKATKQIDAAALLLFADKVAEEHIFKDGIRISDEEMLAFMKEEDEIDDNIMAFDALRSIIAGNDNHFIDKAHCIEPKGETWGRIEDGGKTVIFIKSFFDREIREAGYDPGRLARWMATPENNFVEDGRLDKDGKRKENESHIDKPVRGTNPEKPNGQTRCYVLHMDGGANIGSGYAKERRYDSAGNELTNQVDMAKVADVTNDPYVQEEIPF